MPYSGGGSTLVISDTTYNDDVDLILGTGADANLVYNTTQTPDSLFLGVGQDSRCLVIGEKADSGFDFAHAQQTHPTVFIQSATQSTTEWGALGAQSTSMFTLQGGSAMNLGFSPRGAGTNRLLAMDTVNVILANNATIGFNSNADAAAAAPDAFLTREAAAILQMGSDVNGAAVAQTFKAHDGITGTDVAGANLTIAGGRGTGTGAAGNVILQAAPSLTTGTTAHTLTDRHVIVAKAKALTAAAATGFVRIACAQGTVVGGFCTYSIEANDGTEYQCRSGIIPFAIVNKTGTETGTVGTVGAATEVVAVSSGTLTNTMTLASNAADTMDLSANAASSLTETTLRISYQVFLNAGTGNVTAL